RKRWLDARDELRKAIACQPQGEYQAHANLAQVYRELKEPRSALAELDRAIAARPGDGGLYYTRAEVRLGQGDRVGARRDFEQAVTCGKPQDRQRWLASAHVELGYLKHQAGQYDAALADYDRALQVVLDYAPAHRQRAETLLALGHQREAGEALDAYLKRGRAGATVYRARGLIHSSLRQYAEAALAYTRALQSKRDPGLLAYRGWAHLPA